MPRHRQDTDTTPLGYKDTQVSMGKAVLVCVVVALVAMMYQYGTVRLEPDLQNADDIVWIYLRRKYTRIAAVIGDMLGISHPCNTSRAITTYLAPPPPFDATDIEISDGVLGGTPVRFYSPKNRVKNGPAFLWIHGGGWTTYSVADDDFLCVEFAKRLGILVVSIEYRLAPEFIYPIPFDDCYNAAADFLNTAQKYNVNPDRVAIGGSSAGGNLAAAVSLKLRDSKHAHQPSMQILSVPCLQATDFMTPSYQENEFNAMLPKWWMINYWLWYALGNDGHHKLSQCSSNDHTSVQFKQSKQFTFTNHDLVARKYRGDEASYTPISKNHGDSETWRVLKGAFADPYFAPLMAQDLNSLPQAYVLTAQYDVLRDDGIMYAKRLRQAGVSVVHHNYEGAIHSVIHTHKFKLSQKCMEDLVMFMSTHL